MSMKVFNGYRLPKMSLDELQVFSTRVREEIQKVHYDLYLERVAEMAALVFDLHTLGWHEDIKRIIERDIKRTHPLKYAIRYIRDREREVKQDDKRDSLYDFSCELVLIPIKDAILMLLFAEQKQYVEAIEAIEEVERYYYWNNTDKPEDIPDSEWNKRGQDWEQAFSMSKHSIPALCGFTITCTLPYIVFPDAEKVVTHIPDYNERIKYVKAIDRYRNGGKEPTEKEYNLKKVITKEDILKYIDL